MTRPPPAAPRRLHREARKAAPRGPRRWHLIGILVLVAVAFALGIVVGRAVHDSDDDRGRVYAPASNG